MAGIAPTQNIKCLKPRAQKNPFPFEIDQIWIDREVEDHPQTIRILNILKDVPADVIDDPRGLKKRRDLSSAKKQLLLTLHRGNAFKPCQGMGGAHTCCNLRVLDLISGCPMDCSYCVLQSYLANNPVTAVYVNIEAILAEVAQFLSANQNRFFRICTGELSDSLALDWLAKTSEVLIPFFAGRKNALLELKTKTTFVDHLLELRHKNRTVISWSVNTPDIIASEERGTATLDERLFAAQRAANAGFQVGFHFDPIILTRTQADIADYLDVVDKIFEAVEPRQIAWVSLGLLRYPPDLAEIATRRFAGTKIFTGELVPAGNKIRYPRFIREAALRPIWARLSEKLSPRKIYLCMETPAVWEKIDPSVKSNSCLEKRLCNTEAIPFDFRAC